MAYPTPVNSVITDAVTQTNVLNIASMPGAAAGNLAAAASQAFAVMMADSAAQQTRTQMVADAAAARCVAILTAVTIES